MTPAAALDRTILLCRYLVPDASDESIVDALMSTTIAIVVDAANVKSDACQSAIVTLAQLGMQTGCSVHLVGPDVILRHTQPPWHGATLGAVLADIAANSIPGVTFGEVEQPDPSDLVFVFGDTASAATDGWRVSARRWTGWIEPVETDGSCWHGDFPIGGLGAAALAATEAFKCAMRRLGPKGPRVDELLPARRAIIRLGDEATPTPAALGRVDCISGGAIVQAALHALLRVRRLTGDIRVVEPEVLDLTNCNRYALSRRSQVGHLKVDILAQCSSSSVAIRGTVTRLEERTAGLLEPLAPIVVVGTDNLPSRWDTQKMRPRWLVVGGTTEFMAMASEHDGTGGCARCVHSHDDGVRATIPTVSFVSYLAGLTVCARVLQHAAGHDGEHHADVSLLFSLRQDLARGTLHYPNLRSPGCPLCRPAHHAA
jgi:hypothetical protein